MFRFAGAASVFSFFALALSAPVAAQAGEQDYLSRFQGRWSGTGSIQRDASGPRQVACSVDGQPDSDRLVVSGSCRAAVIFTRHIGADLTFDPATGTYSGTYVGAKVGPARLSGRRRGDEVALTIRWPRPVNGDTEAAMVIRNDGEGGMRITVADNVEPGGPVRQTSEIVLKRR